MHAILVTAAVLFGPVIASGQGAKPPVDPPTLAELQSKIDGAIHRGVDAILRAQQADGTWPDHGYAYPVGPTALCTYALLKCGLGTDHPAVVRALTFLEKNLSETTYGAACQLMAFEATKDKRYKPQMTVLLRRLLEWQKGGWAYPHGHMDLSNTQYGALGFRAARLAGLRVPKRAVFRLMDQTFLFQERPQRLPIPPDPTKDRDGYARSGGPGEVAGFGYRVPQTNGKPERVTGSMTTAGLGVLLICEELMDGKAPRRLRLLLDRSKERGLNWMRLNWKVDGNPGGGHLYYYLYGLERVGDLMHREVMAGHYWYREGADFLVRKQNGQGAWGGNPQTAFGLLFLKRATKVGSVTSAGGSDRNQRTYLAAKGDAEVELRGAGNPKLAVWISGFNQKRLEKRFPKGGEGDPEVRVLKVEYLIDGKLVHTVASEEEKPWKGDPLAYRHIFKRCGRYSVAARVHAKNPDAGKSGEAESVVLKSPLLIIEVLDLPDAEKDAIRTALSENRMAVIPVEVTASTIRHRWPAGKPWVFDGRLATAWLCNRDDAEPWLKIEPKGPVRVQEIKVWPNQTGAKIKKVGVYLDGGRRPRVIELADPRRPFTVPLGSRRRFAKIEFRVLESDPAGNREVGFAEIVIR